MPLQKNVSRHDQILSVGVIIIIVAIVSLRFAGIPDQYATAFEFFDDPSRYPHDIYMNNTFFFDSSYFFLINKVLGLHKNEIISFAYYLVVSFVAAFFCYRIIRKHFAVENHLTALLVLLLVCLLGRNIPVNTWGGIIPIQPGTATMFAKVLGVMALYFLLENRPWVSSAIITVVISLHIVGDFILPAILFFYILFNSKIDNRNLTALLLPIIGMAYMKVTSNVDISGAENTQHIYEAILIFQQHDADFLEQSKPTLALLVVAFIIFPWLWRNLETPSLHEGGLTSLLKAIYVASLCVFIFGSFYTSIGYRFYLFPPIILVAPVRAMKFFTLFFYISAFVVIVQSTRMSVIEKMGVLLALILVHGESLKGAIYPAFTIAGSFAVSRYFGDRLKKIESTRGLVMTVSVAIVILTALQVVRGGKYNTLYNALGWEHLNRWTVKLDAEPETWRAFSKIGELQDDFVLLPLLHSRTGEITTDDYLNILARKSNFVSIGVHFNFNVQLLREHELRSKTFEEIAATLEAGRPISEQTVSVLRARQVNIAAPREFLTLLSGWSKKQSFENYYLLTYGD